MKIKSANSKLEMVPVFPIRHSRKRSVRYNTVVCRYKKMDNSLVQYPIQPISSHQDANSYHIQDGYTYLELKMSPCHAEYSYNNNGNYLGVPQYYQDNFINYSTPDSTYYMGFSPNRSDSPGASSPRSSVGKARRKRTKFTLDQLQMLEEAYLEHDYIPKLKRMQLAKSLGLPDVQVKVWFQNRRCKSKRKQRERSKLEPTVTATSTSKVGFEKTEPIFNDEIDFVAYEFQL